MDPNFNRVDSDQSGDEQEEQPRSSSDTEDAGPSSGPSTVEDADVIKELKQFLNIYQTPETAEIAKERERKLKHTEAFGDVMDEPQQAAESPSKRRRVSSEDIQGGQGPCYTDSEIIALLESPPPLPAQNIDEGIQDDSADNATSEGADDTGASADAAVSGTESADETAATEEASDDDDENDDDEPAEDGPSDEAQSEEAAAEEDQADEVLGEEEESSISSVGHDSDEGGYGYFVSSRGGPIVVEKTNQDNARDISTDDVDSFQIAYNNFTQTSSRPDLLQCTETGAEFIDDYVELSDNNDNFVGISFFDGEIQELQDLLSSLTESVPTAKATCPKSNLKRKLTSSKLDVCENIKRLRFTYIKVFYFERSQGFCSVPSKGGLTLGMMKRHFFNTTLPIEEYEHNKKRKVIPTHRSDDLILPGRIEKPKNIAALTCSQRAKLLEDCCIQINEEEVMDCSIIRLSRLNSGCDCKEFCDPDVCSCCLLGVECQVDGRNFPCGCVKNNCYNSIGRKEFNSNKVRIHFIKTMKRVSTEIKRVSNRLVGKTTVINGPITSKT